MSFADLSLAAPLLDALADLDYQTPTPVQARAIPAILAGRDLLASARTGSGKTAAFALPILERLAEQGATVASGAPRALVLAPTRELAAQVTQSLRSYGAYLPLRTHVFYGGVPLEPQVAKLRRGVDIAVATPGRLLDLCRQEAIGFAELQVLVLDEADRMLDLGFARELEALFALLPPERQTLLFSATFPEPIRQLAARLLRDPLMVEAAPLNTAAPSVKQWLVPVDKKRKAELFCHLYRQRRWGQVLVFAKTRKGVEQLARTLAELGVPADTIHGDKPQWARQQALARFKAGEAKILVATDVAARGLDIDALPLVVNVDLPTVAEDYIHRIGRTGRAGASGEAVSLVCADEAPLLAGIEKLLGKPMQRLEQHGFEPEHRVPATSAAPAAKPARAGQQAPGKRGGGAHAGAKPGTRSGPKPGSKPGSKPGPRPAPKTSPGAGPKSAPRPASPSGKGRSPRPAGKRSR